MILKARIRDPGFFLLRYAIWRIAASYSHETIPPYMNKQPSITLSIPQSCHESWDEMIPSEQGRFCQSCHKTVTDFSTMSDKELISFFSNPQQNVCGRFHAEQLNREVSMPANTRRRPLISIAAMVAALSVAIPSVQANNKPEKTQMASDKSNTQQSLDTIPHVTGIVKDGANNAALPGAIVKIKGHDIQTVTDSAGKFEFRIPANLAGKKMTLEVRCFGFAMQEVAVPWAFEVVTINIPMQYAKSSSGYLGAVVITTATDLATEKRTPWQRFKCKVGQLFR
jgi:hypothetical protein